MMIRYALCILLFALPVIFAEDECANFIKNLPHNKNNFNPATPEFGLYYASSGKNGRLDLGSKTNCELNPKMRYYIVAAIFPAPSNQSPAGFRQEETGVCIPEYCNKEALSKDQNLLRQLSQANGWPITGGIVLHDPNAIPPRKPMYYTLINIFYGLVGLCIVSTIVNFITKTAENKFSQGKTKKNYSVWLFKSFDVLGNLKSLYKTAEENGQSDHLSSFNFLRVFAIIWVIAFHAMCRNLEMFKNRTPSTHPDLDRFIWIGDIAPGFFFFLGGFLAVFSISSKAANETGSGLVGYLSDLFHRLLKIYPGVCVAILCYWIVMPGLLNGTLWGRYIGAIQVCEERWQEKFLLKDNLHFQPFDHCASWTWYIDVDCQVYWVLAILAYVFIQHKYLKYVVYIAIGVMSYYSFDYGLQLIHETERTGRNPKEVWYLVPYTRAYEILIGAFFGFQYYEYAKLKLTSNLVSMWERYPDFRYVCVAIGAYINYYAFFTEANQTVFITWTANEWEYTKRLYLSIGTALILVPLANNCSSFIKAFMSLRIFQILGKLCFGAYLLHWPLQLAVNYRTEHIPDNYDHTILRHNILLNILHSFAAAFVYYLVLEKPLLNIEAHFTKRQKPTADTAENQTNAQYKVISEFPDHDVSMAEQYSVMDASTMRADDSPISPDNKSVRSMRSTKSTRSTRQVGDSISIVHDVEMGKFDHYEEKDLDKSRSIVLNK